MSIALFILVTPFVPFLHLLFSDEQSTLNFIDFIIDHGFVTNQVFAWFCLLHLSSFVFALLIYFFSHGIWRKFLLFPIGYFATYPVWIYKDSRLDFSNFILSGSGIGILLVLFFLISKLDRYVKAKLVDRPVPLTFKAGCREVLNAWTARYNREVRKTLNLKPHLSLREYIHRVYFYSVIMEKRDIQDSDKQHIKRYKSWDFGISLLLILVTFLLIVHHWIPENEMQSNFLGIRIESFGFKDSSTFMFYTSNKLVLFLLGLIWLMTSPYWWRWAILSPTLFYFYQFWEILQPVGDLASAGNLKLLPAIFLIVLGITLLWNLINSISLNREYHLYLKSELENSLREVGREEAKNYLLKIKVNNPEIL
jgi:hypothetical protein